MWLRNAIRNLARKRRADAELDEEVRGYVEMLAEEKMRNGSDARAARREAKMELGGVEQVKEKTREARAGHFLETLWQDLRYGARMLRKNPGFTIVAVLTLALGIGANTAIFSVVESVLLRPLPYDHPESLVEIWNTYMPTVPLGGLSPGDFHDWQKRATTVTEIAGYSWVQHGVNLTGDGDPQRLEVSYATSNLFPVLGVRPVVGRSFVPEEDRTGSAPVVMLSNGLWRSRFGADPGVVGRSVTLDGQRYTVIGVLPAISRFVQTSDVWMPMGQLPDDLSEHVHHEIVGIARLKPGVKIAQARAEFETLNHQSAVAYPTEHINIGMNVRPIQDASRAQMQQSLLLLFAAVGLVLLIACANIVNLLLARNTVREKEIALRTALGANPWRLVRQLLTESTLLALLGGGLGIALAAAGVKILGALAPTNLAAIQKTQLDGSVFLFTIAICLAVGIVCGLLPALQVRKTNVNIALKQGSKGTGAFGGRRLHNFVVVSEIALALVPLIGAGLLLRSLAQLMEVSPGFRADHILTMEMPVAAISPAELQKLTTAQQLQAINKQAREFEQIAEQVKGLPGVEAVGGIDLLPLSAAQKQETRFLPEGELMTDKVVRPVAEFRTVSLGYFSALGLPLVSGREFTQADWSLQNVMVNEALARRFWGEGDAVGKRINLCTINQKPCWYSIIGVVGNVHEFGLDGPPTFDIYFSGGWTQRLVIRTASDPHLIAASATDVIHKIDPTLPVTDVRTADELLAESVAPRRFSATLIGIFAGLALLLAAVGIHGVMSYMVGQRTQEIGLRVALGAQPGDVLRLIVGHGAKLTLVGIAIGAAGALALTRLMKSMLYGVSATDPVTFMGVAILLTAVALAACYVPARRAMKVDPMVALRYE
jgi:putative ABC transport system permease protein